MPGVQDARAVGGADRERHAGQRTTGPTLPDRCGVRLHHPRLVKHTGNELAVPPCGPAWGEGLSCEASTRVDDPWIDMRMPSPRDHPLGKVTSTRVEGGNGIPPVTSHESTHIWLNNDKQMFFALHAKLFRD